MLLVLWVIRLLNGADITPGGQGVGFDCVIEFSFFFVPSFFFFFFLFFSGSWEEDFCVTLGSRSMSSVLVGSQGFSAHGSPWRPLWENVCASQQNVCLRVSAECEYVRMHFCESVFVPPSASVLCCAVTCSQISQRIYHPLNCLWVVDKMAPIHSRMKTLRG